MSEESDYAMLMFLILFDFMTQCTVYVIPLQSKSERNQTFCTSKKSDFNKLRTMINRIPSQELMRKRG